MASGFFKKDEGFFPASQLKRFKPLPPVLKIKVPSEVKKTKEKTFLQPLKPQMVMDIECYINYFLVKFKRVGTNKYKSFEMVDDEGLDRAGIKKFLREYEIITFNGNNFDIPLLKYALQFEDVTNEELKHATNELISRKNSDGTKSGLSPYQFTKKYKLEPLRRLDHIDLIEMAPVKASKDSTSSRHISLKMCGARLHCEVLQDLPYPEDTVLTDDQMDHVEEYCGYDLDNTELLLLDLQEEIQLRRAMSEQYKVNLMSKSDAQIAEEVIRIETLNRTGLKVERPDHVEDKSFYYRIPDFISFTNPKLNHVLDILENNEFFAPAYSKVVAPQELTDLTIKIGSSTYRMGIGGLHSTEKRAFHVSDDEYTYYDYDVTSYYPQIIINSGLYPKSVGPVFLDIFQDIVDERVKAKHAGDKVKADSLKICVNGTYGKTGSPYSFLYAPDLMIQVTITGQLSVLMLIDALERRGFSVISGNTDGITIRCKNGEEAKMQAIVDMWCKRTGFDMESAVYAGMYSRDVNNYIAIKPNGDVKLKGCFALSKRHKNPENDVCSLALIEYLKFGTPLEKTIKECDDVRMFVSVRDVNGGAVKDGKYLGKAIRWYHAVGAEGAIHYKTNNNMVPTTEGVKPIMRLPKTLPKDIDYSWYIDRCKEMFQ